MTPRLELPPSAEVTPSSVERVARELEDSEIVVEVREERSGRVTGWRVECSSPAHGRFPLELRGRDRAVIVAGRHSQREHGGRAKVKVRRAR